MHSIISNELGESPTGNGELYIVLELSEFPENILEWCYDTYGSEGPRADGKSRWFKIFKKIYFHEERDALWFIMKWSG